MAKSFSVRMFFVSRANGDRLDGFLLWRRKSKLTLGYENSRSNPTLDSRSRLPRVFRFE